MRDKNLRPGDKAYYFGSQNDHQIQDQFYYTWCVKSKHLIY